MAEKERVMRLSEYVVELCCNGEKQGRREIPCRAE